VVIEYIKPSQVQFRRHVNSLNIHCRCLSDLTFVSLQLEVLGAWGDAASVSWRVEWEYGEEESVVVVNRLSMFVRSLCSYKNSLAINNDMCIITTGGLWCLRFLWVNK
jgi:hypothetical protein